MSTHFVLDLVNPALAGEIDDIVVAALSGTPTVIVSYPLGTVVSYAILKTDPRRLYLPIAPRH